MPARDPGITAFFILLGIVIGKIVYKDKYLGSFLALECWSVIFKQYQ